MWTIQWSVEYVSLENRGEWGYKRATWVYYYDTTLSHTLMQLEMCHEW